MTRKHLVKKCTAGLLVSCLLCGSLPMTVMAQETTLDKVIGTVDSTLGTATQSIYTYVVNNGTAALDDIQNYVTANFLADYPEAQAAFAEQIAEWKANLTTAAVNYAAVALKIADEIVGELKAFEAKYGDDIDDIIESVQRVVEYWMNGSSGTPELDVDGDGTIQYVSLGDSMTNGYGLDDYEPSSDEDLDIGGIWADDKYYYNVNGYMQAPAESYPALFAEWLNGYYTDKNVELTQLATSSFCAEYIWWLLNYNREDGFEFNLDGRGNRDVNSRFDNYYMYTADTKITDADAILVEAARNFQDSLSKADIISIGVGSNNFSSYMTDHIGSITGLSEQFGGSSETYYQGFTDLPMSDEDAAKAKLIYDQVIALLKAEMNKQGVTLDEEIMALCESVAEAATYTTIAYVLGYKGIVDFIVENNRDAQILIVGLTNWMKDMEITINEDFILPFGDILDILYETANLYMAGLPAVYDGIAAYENVEPYNIYYVATGNDVELIIEAIADKVEAGEPAANCVTSMTRRRIIRDVKEMVLYPVVRSVVADMMASHPNVNDAMINAETNNQLAVLSIDNVEAYEKDEYTPNTAMEKTYFEAYLGIEKALLKSSLNRTIDASTFLACATAFGGDGIMNVVNAGFAAEGIDLTSGEFSSEDICNAIINNSDPTLAPALQGLSTMFLVVIAGEGVACHPSAAGHETIKDALVKAYTEQYTGTDYIIDKVEELGALIAEYGPEALEKLYQYAEEEGYIDMLKEEALRIKGEVCDYINETVIPCLEGKKAALEQKLDDLYKELVKLEEELKDAAEDVKEQIEAEIEKVKAMIEDVKAALEELNAAINDLVEYVNSVIEAVDNLIEALQNVNEDLMGYVDAVQDALTKLGEAIDYIEDVIADINDAIDDAQEAFVKAVEDLIVLGEQVAEEIKAAAEEAAKIIAKLEEEAKKIPGLIEEAKAFAEKVIAEFQNTVETSLVKDTYLLKEDSYYVAIGDESVAAVEGKAYAQLVAEQLFANTEDVEAKYEAFAMADGKRAEDLVAFVNSAEVANEIKKADLVTIGLSHNEILEYVVDQVYNTMVPMGGLVEETDWAKYVGAEGAAEIVKAVAELREYIADYDEENADLLTFAIEQYAYASVSYAMYYAEAINAIHALSPDALVVIVGMYNALEDIEVLGVEVGKYIDAAVKAMNLYSAVYAVLTENTMYVDAPDVDILGTENDLITEFVRNDAEGYRASADGHDYIKEQILGQVEQEYQLGDANGDGKINSIDAMLTLQYSAKVIKADALNLEVVDVNGDGRVNSVDAMLILQYSAKVIKKFPAEG